MLVWNVHIQKLVETSATMTSVGGAVRYRVTIVLVVVVILVWILVWVLLVLLVLRMVVTS